VIRRNYFTAAGSFALVAGIGVQHFTHGNLAHFAGGFLMGISIALLILGLGRRSRRISG
jgi:hypothetical protein